MSLATTHGADNMPEPASSAAAGAAAGWKALSWLASLGGVGAALAAIVVMCITPPRSAREWPVALISTVMSSLGLGAGLVKYLELTSWIHDSSGQVDPIGLVGIFGLVFFCGLPGWAIVRWTFAYMEKRKDKDIVQVANELKGVVTGQAPAATVPGALK